MQSISHHTEVKHCSSFCSLIVNPKLKLTAKNRQKLTAHGLKDPVLQNMAATIIYIYIFFFPRREGNRIKTLEVYCIETLEVYRIKTLEVYCIKKKKKKKKKKNTRGVSHKNTRGVSCNSTRGVSCKILEVLNVHLR